MILFDCRCLLLYWTWSVLSRWEQISGQTNIGLQLEEEQQKFLNFCTIQRTCMTSSNSFRGTAPATQPGLTVDNGEHVLLCSPILSYPGEDGFMTHNLWCLASLSLKSQLQCNNHFLFRMRLVLQDLERQSLWAMAFSGEQAWIGCRGLGRCLLRKAPTNLKQIASDIVQTQMGRQR